MIHYQENDRQQALRSVLAMLRSPIAILSVPDREVAYELARFHKITAEDLLDLAVNHARNT